MLLVYLILLLAGTSNMKQKITKLLTVGLKLTIAVIVKLVGNILTTMFFSSVFITGTETVMFYRYSDLYLLHQL